MSMLELYHNNISVCAQKVRVVLAEKNLPWTSHHLTVHTLTDLGLVERVGMLLDGDDSV
jgi:glutathione S-transferase